MTGVQTCALPILSREIAFEEEESKLEQCKVNRPNIRICCTIFWDFIRHTTEIISRRSLIFISSFVAEHDFQL